MITKTGGPLAVDNDRDLFVAQGLGVLEYPWNSASGSYPSGGSLVPGATELSGLVATAMAFDGYNDLFVASGENVLEFTYNSVNGTWAASGNLVATVSPGTAVVGGIAVDPVGDLFVSNPSASQVLEYEYNQLTGTYPVTGTVVAGVGGTGNGLDQLNGPTSLAVYSGNLFVFDAGSARVVEFSPEPGTVGFEADGTVIFSGNIDNSPENGGMAIGGEGNVFFGNDYNTAVVYEAPVLATYWGRGHHDHEHFPDQQHDDDQHHDYGDKHTTTTTAYDHDDNDPAGRLPRMDYGHAAGWFVRWGNGSAGPPISPVSCAPGTAHCVAVLGSTAVTTVYGTIGQGVAVTSDLTDWASYDSLPSQFVQVLSISCPTSTRCVAAGTGMSDVPVIAVSTDGGVSWA